MNEQFIYSYYQFTLYHNMPEREGARRLLSAYSSSAPHSNAEVNIYRQAWAALYAEYREQVQQEKWEL